ncbi:MAG: flagellin FliC [Silvanigrellales bacterium]|jgi:flagellin|nr:flagellin FliC [Silvanigrellales bacterium]
MGLRIKTNVESLTAQRRLEDSRKDMSESLNRLSSGLRINKSADDAAGLAVSESMRAKIRGLAQAKRNANDGISFLQVAEGGLSELSNSMIRMRELTTQAASDTIGSKEREFLNREFEQLGAELTRIKDETEFNGLRVFNTDGIPSEGLAIQVGVSYRGEGSQATEDSDVVRIQLDQLEDLNTKLSDLPSLAITGESGRELGGGETNDIFTKLDDAVGSVTNFRASLGAMQSRMNSTITSIDVSTENLNAAQSRIRDVDYAQETAKLTQSRILASAGTAVLSQANQTPETVLQLLR